MNKVNKYRRHRNPIHVFGMCVFNILFRTRKVKNNKIFFLNFSNQYDCNPKYICEELLKEYPKYELVFATSKHNNNLNGYPKHVRVISTGTAKFYKEIYSSKVIIQNDIKTAFLGVYKKKNQILIDTWHGSIGIKAFGKDANNDKLWHRMARKSAKMTDYMISNSDFENEIYRKTFWAKNEILKLGHPRNDILFTDQKDLVELKNRICESYKISNKNKLCLYAPTFRDDLGTQIYEMDFEKLAKALSSKFGGECTILFRYHHLTNEKASNKIVLKNAVDVSDYPDGQELLAIIDCGITDYSSWISEYVLRRKPGFIYAPDADEYINNERKLTIPLEELPFPLAKNMDNLLQNISAFNIMNYVKECDMFLKMHGSVDDGHASQRVAKKIEELIK